MLRSQTTGADSGQGPRLKPLADDERVQELYRIEALPRARDFDSPLGDRAWRPCLEGFYTPQTRVE